MGVFISFFKSEPPERRFPTFYDFDDDDIFYGAPVDENNVYVDDKGQFISMLLALDLTTFRVDKTRADKEQTDKIIKFLLSTQNMFISNSAELPLTYSSLPLYKQSYLPLMFYDAWAQIVEDFFKIDTKEHQPLKLEKITFSFTTSGVNRVLKFIKNNPSKSTKGKIKNYLVFLQVEQSLKPEDISNKTKTILGFVTNYKWKKSSKLECTIEVFNSEWLYKGDKGYCTVLTITPVCNIKTILNRVETLSLMCKKYDFKNAFLQLDWDVFGLNFNPPLNFKLFDDAATFNDQQKRAVVACFNAVNLERYLNRTVLIQSPPGTGKTHTLVAIVNSLLEHYFNNGTPNRILICTNSFGAIDTIARRLMKTTNLKLVRSADKSHPQVIGFHLDQPVYLGYSYQRRKNREKRGLTEAKIILSTLNSVQNDCMKVFVHNNSFRCVIIDEAGQAMEPDSLIPLIYPTTKLILIGDHHQLPATVISDTAQDRGYGRSLFERFYRHLENTSAQLGQANPVIMLQTQYRMHEEICRFPSAHFYCDRLQTPRGTGQNLNIFLTPYLVFDVSNTKEEKTESSSTYNVKEAAFVCRLLEAIFQTLGYNLTIQQVPKTLTGGITIGVITFYGGQKEELTSQLKKRLFKGGALPDYIDVNTVDAFQGQERDIVILSCVRAFDGSRGSVGFVKSQQRMNVALTRAKSALYVALNADSFRQSENWAELLTDAVQRDRLRSVNYCVSSNELEEMISPGGLHLWLLPCLVALTVSLLAYLFTRFLF